MITRVLQPIAYAQERCLSQGVRCHLGSRFGMGGLKKNHVSCHLVSRLMEKSQLTRFGEQRIDSSRERADVLARLRVHWGGR